MNRTVVLLLCAVVATAVFVADLLLPLGVAAGVPYVAVVLIALWSPIWRDTFLVAAAGTALTAIGFFLSPVGGELWKVVFNRSLAVFAIWTTAILALRFKRSQADLADAQQAKLALQESEARFQNIFNSSHDAVFVIDPSRDRILDANPQACDLLKYSRDELLSVAVSDIHQQELAEFQNFVQSVYEHGRGWMAELTCRDKSGELIPVEISASTLNVSGRRCMLASVRDIAERKNMQEALQQSLERLQGILDTVPEAIISIDEAQQIVSFNQGASVVFGYTPEEVLGHPLDLLLPDEARAAHRQQVSTFAGSEDVARQMAQRGEIRGRRKTGEHFSAEASISKVWANDQWIFTAVLRDITERKQAERQILHAEKLAAVGRLVASIAHEFNNPVYGIRNVLEQTIERVRVDSAQEELLRLAVSECNRMANLVRKLQEFNRPTSDRMVPMNIHQAIDDILRLTQKTFKSKGILLTTHYAPDVPAIDAVEDQIKQVILNLLQNAEDAIPESGGVITVTTEVLDTAIRATITDSGCGIAPEHLMRIFDPFFTTKAHTKGTGLGLSTSYTIVEHHGGKLTVESTPGRGTTLSITLPIKRGAVP